MKTIYSLQIYRSSVLRDILFLILGITLIVFQGGVVNSLVKLLGIIIAVMSVISLLKMFRIAPAGSNAVVWAGAVAGLIFGLFIFFMPDVFTGFIAVIFGMMLLWGGVIQLLTLIRALKWTSFSFISFFFPLLSIALGVAMVFASKDFINKSLWLIGLAMTFYAVTDAITQYQMYRKYGELEVRKPDSEEDDDL